MFKVSFKETKDNPAKVVYKVGGITTVTLKGKADLPDFWPYIPPRIIEWVREQLKVELYENYADNTLLVYAEGTAKCMEEDKYDPVLGERIAESKAMIDIYSFFYKLSCKLYDYYSSILFGAEGIVAKGSGWSLEAAVRKYEKLWICESKHLAELIKDNNNV